MATAFSALTRAGAAGTAGWMGTAGISGVTARCRAFRLGRRHCRVMTGVIKAFRCRRLHRLCSLCKEIGCIGLHRVLYDGLTGQVWGPGAAGSAQRLPPGPDDERLDGFAAALLHLSVVGAKVYVKGSPGPGYRVPAPA
ncbi:MAG: hypothetical protein ACLVJH_03740 [Faecalibacterium prausnitzii]